MKTTSCATFEIFKTIFAFTFVERKAVLPFALLSFGPIGAKMHNFYVPVYKWNLDCWLTPGRGWNLFFYAYHGGCLFFVIKSSQKAWNFIFPIIKAVFQLQFAPYAAMMKQNENSLLSLWILKTIFQMLMGNGGR